MLSNLSFRKAPCTFLLHVAILIIIAGAFVTHFYGVEGRLHLKTGEGPVSRFEKTSGPGYGTLPFSIQLVKPVIYYYPGTTTPMDYASHLRLSSGGETIFENATSMNKVMSYDGWRFFQSGISEDSSTLVVSHDPIGTPITYIGYGLSFLSMIFFFFQKRTVWRSMRHRIVTMAIILSAACLTGNAADAPRSIQRPLARNMGKMYVLWNGRVCPVQTMARDITIKMYGTDSYKGLTAEQVLAGWLFYYDDWMTDLESSGANKETINLAKWLGSGAAFRIYPYSSATGKMEWLSLSERRPSSMPLEQWVFMQRAMPKAASYISHGLNIEANEKFAEIIEGQKRYAPSGTLPSDFSLRMEMLFNDYIRLKPLTFALLILAFSGIFFSLSIRNQKKMHLSVTILNISIFLSLIYISVALFVRSFVGGHLPFGNGHETMLSLSAITLFISLFVGRRDLLFKSAMVLASALALLVAVMGEKNPQIAMLVPVLASPWLSIHVMLVILSYAAFTVMAILALISLIVSDKTVVKRCVSIDRLLLTPAVFLLAAGIMAGAVWANQSWGRYWGWDPKETCALVTLLIYALPIHSSSIRFFKHDKYFCGYVLTAILAVLFTYFGANYLMPGLHSYA